MPMKTVAFVFGICIAAYGTFGIIFPSGLVWLAQQFVSSEAFYVAAAVRIFFGLILILAAPGSRTPKILRVLGCVVVILGILTALTGLFAVGSARRVIESWLQQGPGVFRLGGAIVLVIGSFVAYACSPSRRPAGDIPA